MVPRGLSKQDPFAWVSLAEWHRVEVPEGPGEAEGSLIIYFQQPCFRAYKDTEGMNTLIAVQTPGGNTMEEAGVGLAGRTAHASVLSIAMPYR